MRRQRRMGHVGEAGPGGQSSVHPKRTFPCGKLGALRVHGSTGPPPSNLAVEGCEKGRFGDRKWILDNYENYWGVQDYGWLTDRQGHNQVTDNQLRPERNQVTGDGTKEGVNGAQAERSGQVREWLGVGCDG